VQRIEGLKVVRGRDILSIGGGVTDGDKSKEMVKPVCHGVGLWARL